MDFYTFWAVCNFRYITSIAYMDTDKSQNQMNAFVKILVGPALKLATFFKKKAEKKYPVYIALRNMGLPPTGNDFDVLYNQALFEFEHSRVNLPLLVQLFAEPKAKTALVDDWRNNTQNKLLDYLEATLMTVDKYADIRSAGIDLVTEINRFNEIFISHVHQARTPHEVEVKQDLREMKLMLAAMSTDTLNLSDQIKEITRLREENRHEAVKNLLLSYKRDRWSSISVEAKYKITANLGVTLMELGEEKEGAQSFIELLQYNMKPVETFSMAAMGYAKLGNRGEALKYADKALELDSKCENAYLAKLFVQEGPLTQEVIDQIIPKALQTVPIIAINVATYLDENGDHETSFQIFSQLERDHPQMDNFRCDILMQMAVNRIHSLTKKEDYYFDQLNEQSVGRLQQALGYLNLVWDYYKHSDLARSHSYVLANRGVVYKALGQPDLAARDLSASLELKKTFFAYSNLFEIYKPAEKWEPLIKEVKQLNLKPEERQLILCYETIAASLNGTVDDILPAVLEQLSHIQNPEVLNKFYAILCQVYTEKKQFGEAEKYALELIGRNPDDAFPYLLAWKVYEAQDDDKSEGYIEKAVQMASEQTPNMVLWELAEALLRLSRDNEAVLVLRKAADIEVYSKLTHNLILAEYNAGNYREAYELADRLLLKYPFQEPLAEIKASVLEATERYNEAESFLREFLAKHPGNKFFRFKLVMTLYKKGDYKSGVEELNKIESYDDLNLNYQFLIADAYIQGGEPVKGLEIGYRLRQENYSNQQVHNRYLQIQTHIQGLTKEDYFPEKVGNDCFVSLRDRYGKQHEYIIVGNPHYQKEIGKDEPIAQDILGKEIGESFERSGNTYTVTGIKWKYTYALHESMDLVQNRFDNQGPIRVFQIHPNQSPLDMIKSLVGDRQVGISIEEIDHAYAMGRSTIGVNAGLLGTSAIKYWGRLVHTSELGVYPNRSMSEVIYFIRLLDNLDPIVLDLTFLLTLHYARAFSLLDHLPNKKYVAQSTVDSIKAEIAEIKSRQDYPDLNVNEVGGQFVKHEVTVEEKVGMIKELSLLLEQTEKIAEIVYPSLPDNFEKRAESEKILGKPFHDTLIIASDKSALILSDDATLRQLASSELNLPGLSTIGVLQYLVTKKLISREEADMINETLIKMNYRLVPVRAALLLQLYQKGTTSLNTVFIRACDTIDPRLWTDEQAARIVADFLRLLMLNVISSSARDMAVQHIVRKLYSGRDVAVVKQYLLQFLDIQFALLPQQKSALLGIVNLL